MGGIHWPRGVLASRLGECVGVRSGIALNTQEMAAALGPRLNGLDLVGDPDTIVRTPSQDYEDAVGVLLFDLGVRDSPYIPPPGYVSAVRLQKEFGITVDPLQAAALGGLIGTRVLPWLTSRRQDYEADIRSVMKEDYGADADVVFDVMVAAAAEYALVSPFAVRDAAYSDIVELSDLFTSERLPAEPESFFDQRFIDYLAQHPDRLGDINWRQFEGLTGEWFSRQGYSVELGPGRGDDGVDVRLSRIASDGQAPETILVQCKRERNKIGKVVVKGLYADILDAGATSGLIVTTSSLAPGAEKVIVARGYPIRGIDRANVAKWTKEMARPGRGPDFV